MLVGHFLGIVRILVGTADLLLTTGSNAISKEVSFKNDFIARKVSFLNTDEINLI